MTFLLDDNGFLNSIALLMNIRNPSIYGLNLGMGFISYVNGFHTALMQCFYHNFGVLQSFSGVFQFFCRLFQRLL
ncbi:MAG: hypothetical protein BWY07_01959 [Candidatus Hydrogenedentes bacterium ADurb.Bin170]|nr:MAG: hypothetical protein BWY07_01959 [Candidatus Hydrogenedentes bacterium ADurb.Bin170]